MAANSWIENLNVERLESDPVPLQPGRIWFNTTDKRLKFSTLNDSGAVIVKYVPVDTDIATSLASANTYTDGKISALVAGAPGLLDTLNELSLAIANDPNFATSVATQIVASMEDS